MLVNIGDIVTSPDFPWKIRVLKVGMTNHRRGQIALIEAVTDQELKKMTVFTDRLSAADSDEITVTADHPGYVFMWTNGWKPNKLPVGWDVFDPEYPKKEW